MNGDGKIIVDLINKRIDGVENRISDLDERLVDKVHKHCVRIKILEKWRYMILGGFSLTMVVVSIIAIIK